MRTAEIKTPQTQPKPRGKLFKLALGGLATLSLTGGLAENASADFNPKADVAAHIVAYDQSGGLTGGSENSSSGDSSGGLTGSSDPTPSRHHPKHDHHKKTHRSHNESGGGLTGSSEPTSGSNNSSGGLTGDSEPAPSSSNSSSGGLTGSSN